MSVIFFLAPFKRSAWLSENIVQDGAISDLSIKPESYRQALIERWSEVEFQPSPYHALRWILPPSRQEFAGLAGSLYKNLQVVSFGVALNEDFLAFIFFHRNFVSSQYRLYLFNSASADSLEIKLNTTETEIITFTGFVD